MSKHFSTYLDQLVARGLITDQTRIVSERFVMFVPSRISTPHVSPIDGVLGFLWDDGDWHIVVEICDDTLEWYAKHRMSAYVESGNQHSDDLFLPRLLTLLNKLSV